MYKRQVGLQPVAGASLVLEKQHSAGGGSGKLGKDRDQVARKSSRSKRVRSARRVLPPALAPEGAKQASAAWLEGGLALEDMWALEVEGLAFSEDESAPAGAPRHI